MYAAGGNPYGTSFVTGTEIGGPDATALEAAKYQGRRLAQITFRLLGVSHFTDATVGNGHAGGARAATTSQTA